MLSEESIASYLCENPDFFVKNSSLLKEITVPHFFGKNITSLIEQQVMLLQKENNELKNNIEKFEKKSIFISGLRKDIFTFFPKFLNVKSVIEYDRLLRNFFYRFFESFF